MKKIAEKLVFFLDQHGRALTQDSINDLLDKIFDVLKIKNVRGVTVTGPSINRPDILLIQIKDRELDGWELMYFRDEEGVVLLSEENKKELAGALENAKGTSSDAIHGILERAGAYKPS